MNILEKIDLINSWQKKFLPLEKQNMLAPSSTAQDLLMVALSMLDYLVNDPLANEPGRVESDVVLAINQLLKSCPV